MKLFKHLRLRSKNKSLDRHNYSKEDYLYERNGNGHNNGDGFYHRGYHSSSYYNAVPATDYTKLLPPKVLYNILTFVCPHTLDSSLSSSEESMTEDGCMLCDMRDLAHCALLSKRWYNVAQPLLYVYTHGYLVLLLVMF